MADTAKKKVDPRTKDQLLALIEKQEMELEEIKAREPIVETKEVVVEKTLPSVEDKYSSEKFDLRPDEYVEIISLCPNDLYLSSGKKGDMALKFSSVGESKHVLYSELLAIINHHPRFARNGDFYIVDKRIVKRNSLIDFYDDILTKEEIELVMTSDSETAIRMFDMANETQQSYLSDMFIKKIVSGEAVDMNMVYKMGKILGTDIASRAEDAKEFKSLLLKK